MDEAVFRAYIAEFNAATALDVPAQVDVVAD
jgi:hypothetical protein